MVLLVYVFFQYDNDNQQKYVFKRVIKNQEDIAIELMCQNIIMVGVTVELVLL